jgi:hypothetical protein
MEVITLHIIMNLIEFLFRVFAWVIITVGCLIYGLWAVLSNRLREFADRTREEKIQRAIDEKSQL